VVTDSEVLTRANIAEGSPFPGCPLSISVLLRLSDFAIQENYKDLIGKEMETNPWTSGRMLAVHRNSLFMNVVNVLLRIVGQEIGHDQRALDMATYGHLGTTPAIHRMALQRYGVLGLRTRIRLGLKLLRRYLSSSTCVQQVAGRYAKYSFPVDDYSNCLPLYNEICRRLSALSVVSSEHLLASGQSSLTQTMAFIALLNGRKDWTLELSNEMTQLLSSINDVESAGVPVELKDLAAAIARSDYSAEFVRQSSDQGRRMLEEDRGAAGSRFRDFLARHGHRGIMEGDFSWDPWALDPLPLISALQTMVANPCALETPVRIEMDTVSTSGLQTNWFRRHLLAFLIGRARAAVVDREKTKSLLIRTTHCFRLAYRRLGQLMVSDGKIPDAGLVHFLTHSELQQVISSRGTVLIAKAIRRRKLHSEAAELVYPELSVGVPQRLEQCGSEESPATGFQLSGTPVFKGTVRGTVRVALNVQEARDIRCGEILVTRCTDIGWTPYFPLLAGVVTELGGLVSHGAVVAREYGLPCIVGAQKATQSFRTGDRVILDGTRGTVTLVDVHI